MSKGVEELQKEGAGETSATCPFPCGRCFPRLVSLLWMMNASVPLQEWPGARSPASSPQSPTWAHCPSLQEFASLTIQEPIFLLLLPSPAGKAKQMLKLVSLFLIS